MRTILRRVSVSGAMHAAAQAARDAEVSRPGHVCERIRGIIDGNHEGMEVLRAHGSFTPQARALMDALDVLDERHRAARASI